MWVLPIIIIIDAAAAGWNGWILANGQGNALNAVALALCIFGALYAMASAVRR